MPSSGTSSSCSSMSIFGFNSRSGSRSSLGQVSGKVIGFFLGLVFDQPLGLRISKTFQRISILLILRLNIENLRLW